MSQGTCSAAEDRVRVGPVVGIRMDRMEQRNPEYLNGVSEDLVRKSSANYRPWWTQWTLVGWAACRRKFDPATIDGADMPGLVKQPVVITAGFTGLWIGKRPELITTAIPLHCGRYGVKANRPSVAVVQPNITTSPENWAAVSGIHTRLALAAQLVHFLRSYTVDVPVCPALTALMGDEMLRGPTMMCTVEEPVDEDGAPRIPRVVPLSELPVDDPARQPGVSIDPERLYYHFGNLPAGSDITGIDCPEAIATPVRRTAPWAIINQHVRSVYLEGEYEIVYSI